MLKQKAPFDAVDVWLDADGHFSYSAQVGECCGIFPESKVGAAGCVDEIAVRNERGRLALACQCGFSLVGDMEHPDAPATPGESGWTNDAQARMREQFAESEAPDCPSGPYGSVAVVPVWGRGRILGMLKFYDRRKGQITPIVVEALESLASHVGEALLRKRAEIERERLTRAIEQSGESIVITDSLGKIVYVNPAFEATTGYSREEVLGINPRVLKSGMHDADFYRQMWEKLKAGQAWEGEIVNRRKDGSLFTEFATLSPVRDAHGRIIHFVAVKRDVSQQKRNEAELAESELRYRTLADSGQVLIWTSGIDKRRDYVNKPWLRFTGRAFEQEQGDGWMEGVHPEDRESCRRAYEGAFDRCESFQVEYRLLHAAGEYRWIRDEGFPRFDREGAFLGYIGHGIDITDRKQSELEQEKLQDQLAQARKMESIGRLAGGIAHDFNNMLQAILGFAEMALDQVDPEAPVHGDIQEIQKAARRSADLTRQLQTFARRQNISPKVLDLNAAIEGMMGMLRRLAGDNVEISWKPGVEKSWIKIDPTQLDQVLSNLCINAADAVGHNGRIYLQTEHAELKQAMQTPLGDVKPGPYVKLTVQDDGQGMEPDVLAHIFEPFFTTKKSGKGTGLGLATVYGIVTQNKGGIVVRSRPGAGSTFEILLPVASPAEISPPAIEDELPASRGDETILLVDDEQNLLQAARRMLESLGYKVYSTDSSLEAVNLFKENMDEIRLLVTDVVMPEMNGPDLVRRLSELRADLRHIYISGYTANLIAEQGVKEQGTSFLAKPFTRNALARKVRQALDSQTS
jgi:PAS domain S-box-containing protein